MVALMVIGKFYDEVIIIVFVYGYVDICHCVRNFAFRKKAVNQ
jgi:hypothetical protein